MKRPILFFIIAATCIFGALVAGRGHLSTPAHSKIIQAKKSNPAPYLPDVFDEYDEDELAEDSDTQARENSDAASGADNNKDSQQQAKREYPRNADGVFPEGVVPGSFASGVSGGIGGSQELNADETEPSSNDALLTRVSSTSDYAGFQLPAMSSGQRSGVRNTRAPPATVRSLPNAMPEEEYCTYLNPLDGRGPYLWTIVSGEIPLGLRLDRASGMLCGTPTEETVATFAVEIVDSLDEVFLISFRLIVVAEEEEEEGSEEETLSITTTALSNATVGQAYFEQLRASGGEEPILWQLSGLPDGMRFTPQQAIISGTPLIEGSFDLFVSVRDGAGTQVQRTINLTVETSPLSLTTSSLPNGTVGSSYRQQLRAQGGQPPYQWQILAGEIPAGFSLQSSSGIFEGTPSEAITTTLRFAVVDQANQTDSAELPFIVETAALSIETSNLPTGTIGADYAASVTATGGVPPYEWALTNGSLANGLEFTSGGFIRGTPTETSSATITIQATDSAGTSIQRAFSLVISGEDLTITTNSLPDASPCQQYNAALLAQGGSPPYLWQLTGGAVPEGLVLQSDGTISGTAQTGSSSQFTASVQDLLGTQQNQTVTLIVASETVSLTSSNDLPAGVLGEPYLTLLGAQGGCAPYNWQFLAGSLPLGLSIGDDGTVSGIPEEIGSFSALVTLSDAVGEEFTFEFSMSISAAELVINTPSIAGGAVDDEYETSFEAIGGLPPYTWSLISGALPQGLALLGTFGTISGVPTEAGDFSFVLQVRDAAGTTEEKSYSLAIDAAPLEVVSTTLPTARIGETFNTALLASGGVLPYRWTLWFSDGSGLPTGINLVDQVNGIIAGTPEEGGIFAFNVQVTDGSGSSSSQALVLAVEEAQDDPSDEDDLIPGGSRDPSAPFGVTQFIAAGSDGKVGLVWDKPNDADLLRVEVIRSENDHPSTRDAGELVFAGNATNVVDTNVVNGTTYYYAAFAVYQDGSVSVPDSSGEALATPQAVTLTGAFDPFADELHSFSPLDPSGCFGCGGAAGLVLGPPRGEGEFGGSIHVASLNARVNDDNGASAPYGGSITLRFTNNIVCDGPGVDFTIFENAFRIFGTDSYWIEPAIVEVSANGSDYYRFPFDFVPHFDEHGELNLNNPFSYAEGFAGVRPVYSNGTTPDPSDPTVSGGDSFDLNAISSETLTWIQYVRITSTGDRWLVDRNGDLVRHSHNPPTTAANGTGNSGFDLDAIAAVNY